MLKKILKFLFKLVVVVLLLIGLLLLIIRFYPQVVIKGINQFTDYQVASDDVKLQFLPLTIASKNLSVKQNQQQLLQLGKADFSVDWMGAINGLHSIWQADFENGTVNFTSLTPAKTQSNQVIKPIRIHGLITALKGSIKNVKYQFSEQGFILIEQLDAKLNNAILPDPRKIEQNIDMHLVIDEAKKPLTLNGKLVSSYKKGINNLQLSLQEIDLSNYINTKELAAKETKEPPVGDKPSARASKLSANKEFPIDWSWIGYLQEIVTQITIEKLRLNDQQVSDIVANLSFDKGINIEQLSANIDNWSLTDNIVLKDRVSVTGKITPLAKVTELQDLITDLQLVSEKLKLSLQGELNVNGISGNNLNSDIVISSLPIEQTQTKGESLLQQLKAYLPMALNSQLKTSGNKIDLQIKKSKFGESDIRGDVAIENYQSSKPKISAKLNSDYLVYINKSEKTDNKAAKKSATLFDKTEIDWQWLNSYLIDGRLSVKQLVYNDFKFKDFSLPLSLQDNTLLIDGFKGKLDKGSLSGTLQLQRDKVANINLKLRADDIHLSSLGVIPKEQIEGGYFDFDADLKMRGDSSSALAASSNGLLKFDLQDSTLKNDSFEIVGSDIFMELFSKLNPFVKSDPSTHIECAVITAPVEKGEVKLKNSLGLVTSKITILGSGQVDLGSEKINLILTPSARKGVGVNVGDLVKFIKVGGTLTKPAPALDGLGLIKSGIATSLALSTGGLSLLASGLLDKMSNAGVCERLRKNQIDKELQTVEQEIKAREAAAEAEKNASQEEAVETQ